MRGKLLRHMFGEKEALTMRSKVDLSKLPHCKDNLVPHIHRVNHCIAHFKRADQRSFLAPQANRSGTRMMEDQERTNMLLQTYSPRTNMLLQTYSPPSLVDSVEEKPAAEIDEDDPDHELDCDLPDLLYDDVCSADTVYQCASCIHCMYSFCFLRECS